MFCRDLSQIDWPRNSGVCVPEDDQNQINKCLGLCTFVYFKLFQNNLTILICHGSQKILQSSGHQNKQYVIEHIDLIPWLYYDHKVLN